MQFNIESSQTAVTDVNIPVTVLESAADLNISISTPNAILELPATLVQALAGAGQNLAISVSRGGEVNNPQDTTVLGSPTEITTDIVGTTQVTIPLEGISIPGDPEAKEAFLASLAVFTYHSDGETEFINGEIIYDTHGNPVSISFPVDKFSTFAIVKISKRTITLTVDSEKTSINGVTYTLDTKPFIEPDSGRTLAPLRFVSEALGAKVEWLPAASQIRVKDGEKEVVLTIDSQTVLLNGLSVQNDCAPVVVPPGRTFLPLRFIGETLGAEVTYDNDTRQIKITKEYGN